MLHTDAVRAGITKRGPEAALIGVTVLWGSTFLVVHVAMDHSGPLFFVGVRFLAAGVVATLIFRKVLRGVTAVEVGAGIAIGATLAAGYGLQTYGLQTIESSTSAFITALYVPLVPLLQWAVFRKAPRPMVLLGVLLAFAGLVLLAGPSSSGLGMGRAEIATLIGAAAIAGEIVLIGYFARTVDPGRITVIQTLAAGLMGLLAMPIAGESIPSFSWWWLGAAIGLGGASCVIQLTMSWAQRSVSPSRATIIYAGEPIWGGVFGRLAGERLPGVAFVGAALIVIGVLVSEIKTRRTTR